MSSLTLFPKTKATIGHKDEIRPLEISGHKNQRTKLGFEAKTSSGNPTALLSIHRRGTNTDTDTKALKIINRKPGSGSMRFGRAFLLLFRRGTNTDTDTKASNKPGPNLNDCDSNNPKGIQATDKPLLDSFIRQLRIKGTDSLESLKSKLLNLDQSENFSNFISYVRNGAFFKHWADHYTKQAKKMASSLNLAA
jgi:hypothetical protein